MAYSVVYFFAVIYLLGAPIIQLVTGRFRLKLEMHALATGVGLAVFAVVSVLLNMLSLPLVWWMFLVVGALLEVAAVVRCRGAKKPTEPARPVGSPEVVCLLIAVLLAAVSCAFFVNGSHLHLAASPALANVVSRALGNRPVFNSPSYGYLTNGESRSTFFAPYAAELDVELLGGDKVTEFDPTGARLDSSSLSLKSGRLTGSLPRFHLVVVD